MEFRIFLITDLPTFPVTLLVVPVPLKDPSTPRIISREIEFAMDLAADFTVASPMPCLRLFFDCPKILSQIDLSFVSVSSAIFSLASLLSLRISKADSLSISCL